MTVSSRHRIRQQAAYVLLEGESDWGLPRRARRCWARTSRWRSGAAQMPMRPTSSTAAGGENVTCSYFQIVSAAPDWL